MNKIVTDKLIINTLINNTLITDKQNTPNRLINNC